MAFLNNILLFALPAVLLPVIIHLLNRLRYRSVDWAAVMFLIKATRSSTRHARLRQYLILLFRTLIILFFVLALARPIIGGWIGMTLAGAPDTVIILLDRSASMEAVDPRMQASKRKQALDVFSKAFKTTAPASRLVLIENVFIKPSEIANASSLKDLALTTPTDTMADIPAMLRAAIDYMIENKTGRTEIWLASDFQQNNWRPDSAEWESLTSQMASLPQDVRVRMLNLQTETTRNRTISLAEVFRSPNKDSRRLDITVDITRQGDAGNAFPMVISMDGSRSQSDLTMRGEKIRHHRTLETAGDDSNGGWGKIELPADDNSTDNTAYFVYGGIGVISAAVVSRDNESSAVFGKAAAPAPDLLSRTCSELTPDRWSPAVLNDLSMLIWQDELPEDKDREAIMDFVRSGGSLVFFPPANEAPGSSTSNSAPEEAFFSWGKPEKARLSSPFRVITWEENDGPLAKTFDGRNLPVAALEINMRRCPENTTLPDNTWLPSALYDDGKPFLLRRKIGRGTAYICTALPREDWSDLDRGLVLVPMIQRIFSAGGNRHLNADSAVCGEWAPENSQEVWTCTDSDDFKDYRTRAGVYHCGGRRVAINMPVGESDPAVLDAASAEKLFGEVKAQVNATISGTKKERLQSEIWHVLICFALLCMMAESGLLLQEKISSIEKTHRLD